MRKSAALGIRAIRRSDAGEHRLRRFLNRFHSSGRVTTSRSSGLDHSEECLLLCKTPSVAIKDESKKEGSEESRHLDVREMN